MFEVGRLCVKIAGRDAGRKCLVIETVDEQLVMIDGQTRRRKCNIAHLEPTEKVLKIKKNASNKEVCEALKEEGIECKEKAEEKKQKAEKPKRATKAKKAKEAPEKK
jgi:large subunit ribosomal protein L14e